MATRRMPPPHPPLHRSRSDFSVPSKDPKPPTLLNATKKAAPPSRRVSMSHFKPLKIPCNAVAVHSRQQEEERKTEKYERMMDQLRRIIYPRTLSANSQTAATTQRETPQVTWYAAGEAHNVPIPGASDLREGPIDSRVDALDNNRRATTKKTLLPLAPTGAVSLVRTVMGIVAAVIHVVLFPLILTYNGVDPTIVRQSMRCGLFVDVVFAVNFALVCNTATYTTHGQLVTTRRAILRQYRKRRLVLDVLAIVPSGVITRRVSWWYGISLFVQLVVRVTIAYGQKDEFQRLLTTSTSDHSLKWLDWLLYSRFAHPVRITRLVLRVCLLTHYMACGWTLLNLQQSHDSNISERSGMALHLHSMYDVHQLLQGQGLETTTVAQDLFASVAVLLGSISLAVMFGHIAILIANFNANETAYQRKTESVFAIMEKLQLPQAIRDRVHQYYGYLHTEYESLDGEVVKFAKDLSHTLELEVVLYKYMDVVMNVPHWIDCSPDFQKQLVLNVTIRVYMPDDFVIRRGEVGTSCFIVNRGICKQYQFTGGNDEFPTAPQRRDPARPPYAVEGRKRPSEMKYLVRDDVPSLDSPRVAVEDGSMHPLSLTRGHILGERALIDNYVRTTDVRAFTYVEMCVLEREPFQRMLTRYPDDREMVLSSMVRYSILQRAAQGRDCPFMNMVHRVAPSAALDHGVAMLVDAMSPRVSDPTIVFGVSDRLEEQLRQRRRDDRTTNHADGIAELSARVEQLQQQLDRIERALEPHTIGPVSTPSKQVTELAKSRVAPLDTAAAHVKPHLPPLDTTATNGETAVASKPLRRLHQRPVRSGSDSVLEAPRSLATHSPYADRLFQTQAKMGCP